MNIPVKLLPHAVKLPEYATPQSAGMDVFAAVHDEIPIYFGKRALIPVGISVSLPSDFMIDVRSRSGIALRDGVIVANSPGTIDSDYRGEIGVILLNTSEVPFIVTRGMKIAQILLTTVFRIRWEKVDELSTTQRGSGGFGSTGV